MQCISVDLPEPDGPMIGGELAALELDRDAVERAHLGLAGAVGLHQVDRPRCRCRGAADVDRGGR